MKRIVFLLLICCTFLSTATVFSQVSDANIAPYAEPKDYEIGGIKVSGAEFSDENAIIAISGLKIGDKIRIPGPEISKAMKALWKLRLYTDIQIYQEKTVGEVVFLEIVVQERPRLSRHSFKGAKKSRHDDINERIDRYLLKGAIVTESTKINAKTAIEDYYKEKGYLDASVSVKEIPDEKSINAIRLEFEIDKKERIKIKDITFSGNENVNDKKLRKKLEGTKRKRRLFNASKLIKADYESDKDNIVSYYNSIGFRDALVAGDSIWRNEKGQLMMHIDINEGNRYYFGDIAWKGNSIYETERLATVLGIKNGDVYNQELLETRLRFSPDGRDVSTLYMDNGYLFFQVDPIEVAINEDSINLEIRIFEGPQATIDKVLITGNDRTHEHVIRRELRTKPGQKFSRSDIIRSQREIISLGYFNPEALGINTPVNPQRGTVDIEYQVEEKPSDQLELSAGWGGAGRGVIGTLGVTFNNFSLRNIFDRSTWSPLPQGDGQKLSVRAQTNGRFFQSYNLSFTEPWLGGKKPNSFTVAGYYTRLTNGLTKNDASFRSLDIKSFSLGLGTRLKFPDDNFISNTTLNIQTLTLNDWSTGDFSEIDGTPVTSGAYNNFSIKQTISRSSVSDPIFPRSGSRITLSGQFTLPYSKLFNRDKVYEGLSAQERFKWLEYHKWRFTAEWYSQIAGKLVVRAAAKIGMIGYYNQEIGLSPFERFVLGGDGLSNQQTGLLGYDILALRGYEVPELAASNNGGAAAFDKFTVELRYPLSLNPNATIYVLAFAEGGNSWLRFKDINPFDLRRSTGLGLRVFLPMFGTLGFDYGIGFDKPNLTSANRWSDFGKFSIVLGFEPE